MNQDLVRCIDLHTEPIVQADKEESAKKATYVKPLIIVLLLIALIPVLLTAGFIMIMTWTTQYSVFTKSRTEMMEELFQITVTDDVKLLHYKDASILIAIDETLTLEVADYEKFLYENIHADVEIYTPYPAEEDTLYYKYVNCRTYIEISPSKNEGKYIITLNNSE